MYNRDKLWDVFFFIYMQDKAVEHLALLYKKQWR